MFGQSTIILFVCAIFLDLLTSRTLSQTNLYYYINSVCAILLQQQNTG